MHTRVLSGMTLLALCALAPPVLARVGEAEVREGPRGGPCFTITPHEERLATPDFQAISVSDGRRLLWKMSMPAGRSFPLNASMCVPYGGRVASLPRSEAADLASGRIYYLHIDAPPARGQAAPPGYEARFCLARQRDGSALVHRIQGGDREGRRLYACAPPARD